MTAFGKDLRHAARVLRGSPLFTAAAVLTLALGIGANTAMFGLVNAVLLRPPPEVADPGSLVAVFTSDYSGPRFGASSYPDYLDFAAQSPALDGLAAYAPRPVVLAEGGRSDRVFAEVASGNYFAVLGVRPAVGRVFLPAEEGGSEAPPVAVLGHDFWRRRFGSDPTLIGRTVRLNGQSFTVVGVAPPGFTSLLRGMAIDLWIPLGAEKLVAPGSNLLGQRGERGLFLVGRLAERASAAEAQSAFAVVARRLRSAYPDQWTDLNRRGRVITVLPESQARVFPQIRTPVVAFLSLLMGVVGVVLLIACANLANLLLARAAGRRREIAVRASLGASRGRLVRQLLTESVLLAVLGGGAGLLVATWIGDALGGFTPPVPVPLELDVGLDGRVLVFAAALSLITGVLFGLVPALGASRPALVSALKDEGTVGGRRRSRVRAALVAAQVALSLVLLVGAGLLVRSLWNAQRIDPGFDAPRVLVASIDLEPPAYDEARGRAFYATLVDRVAGLPGVGSVALAEILPLGLGTQRGSVVAEGYAPRPSEDMELHFNVVSAEYFEAMGIPLRAGRAFSEADGPGAPGVAIVNETFARRYWGARDPVGRRIGVEGPGGPMLEVVGVARDGKYVTLGEEPRPVFYLPFAQRYTDDMTLHVRAAGDPAALAGSVLREARAIDPDVPIFDVKTLEQQIGVSLLPQRLAATVLGAFGALALLLATVGIYAVVASSAAGRTRELGLRMALGARPAHLRKLVLRENAAPVAVGLVLGLAGALAVTRLAAGLLYGVSPADPASYAAVVSLLSAVALLASYVPAARATRLDPLAALRHE